MRRVDEECRRRFEAERFEGGTRPLDEFLPPPDDPTYEPTLEELVLIDLEFRWKGREGDGPAPCAADYAERFPSLGRADVAARVDAECGWLRDQFGDRALAAGARVGRYVLVEIAGRGAFADVWRARDEELGREVALKIPRPELGSAPAIFERARREAQSAAQLSHPGIVSIHQVGEHGGRPYFVSEFVPGPTLAAWFETHAVTPDEAARLVARIADAVEYAHECGVVHRDIKPGNILMGADGRPKLADFGLAQLTEAEIQLTREGQVLGTPAYMAPEQALGRLDAIGPRTDVHALGVLLYELISGKPPFGRETTAATIHSVIREDPPRPSSTQPLSVDLETIVLKALSKAPADRYASAATLASDLRHHLAHEPIRARRRGALGQLVLWTRRNPATALATALGLVAVLVVAALGYASVRTERDRYQGERDRARALLFRSLVGEAEALLEAQGPDWYGRAMEKVRTAASLTDVANRSKLRDLVFRCVSVPRIRLDQVGGFDATDGPARRLAVSADGAQAAGVSRNGQLWIRSLRGDGAGTQRRLDGKSSALSFSADGALLAIGYFDGRLALFDTDTLDAVATWRGSGSAVRAAAQAHGTDIWAAGLDDGPIELLEYDADRGLVSVGRLDGHVGGTLDLCFSPPGDVLVSGGRDRMVRAWSTSDGRSIAAVNVWDPARVVATGGDGKVAASTREGFGVTLFSLDDRDLRFDPGSPLGGPVLATGIDATGRALTISSDGTLVLWSIQPEPLVHVRIEEGAVTSGAVTPLGDLAVACHENGRVTIWRPAFSGASHTWSTEHAAAFVPGTRRLVTDRGAIDYDDHGAPVTRPLPLVPIVAVLADPGSDRMLAVREDGGAYRVDGRNRVAPLDAGLEGVTCGAWGSGNRVALGTADGRVWRGTLAGDRLEGRASDATVGRVLALAFADAGAVIVLGDQGLAALDADGGVSRLTDTPQARGALARGGDVLAASAPDGAVEIRSPDAGGRRNVFDVHTGDVVGLAVASDGRLVASADPAEVRIWAADTGEQAWVHARRNAGPRPVAFDPLGRFLVADSVNPALIDIEAQRVFAWLHERGATSIAVDASGSRVVVGSRKGSLSAWDVRPLVEARDDSRTSLPPGRSANVPKRPADHVLVSGGHGVPVWGLATSPGGHWFATADHVGVIKLWDAKTLDLVRDVTTPGPSLAWCAAFSPDDRTLAANVGRDILLFDVASGEVLRTIEAHTDLVTGLAFHPDRPLLASGSYDKTARLWDTTSGSGRILTTGGRSIHAVEFSPDGSRLAAAASDGSVLLWDTTRAEPGPPRVLGAHATSAWAVGYDPTGRLLASGASDGEIRLWDARTGERFATLRAEPRIRSLSFSAGGDLLAAASYVRPSTTWDLSQIRAFLAELGLDE